MKYFFSIILLMLSAPSDSMAGNISLGTTFNLTTTWDTKTLTLDGTDEIVNRGDEQAFEVHPYVKIGNWEWSGDPLAMYVGDKHTWPFSATIPFAVTKGIYPVLQMTLYRDFNGKMFSAPEVSQLKVGAFDMTDQMRINAPAVKLLLYIVPVGKGFEATLTAQNISDDLIAPKITFFTSHELHISQSEHEVEVKKANSWVVKVDIENAEGTVGSTYPVFAVAQWESHGVHVFSKTSSLLYLREVKSRFSFLVAAILAFLAVTLAAAIFMWRILKEDVKEGVS